MYIYYNVFIVLVHRTARKKRDARRREVNKHIKTYLFHKSLSSPTTMRLKSQPSYSSQNFI